MVAGFVVVRFSYGPEHVLQFARGDHRSLQARNLPGRLRDVQSAFSHAVSRFVSLMLLGA